MSQKNVKQMRRMLRRSKIDSAREFSRELTKARKKQSKRTVIGMVLLLLVMLAFARWPL